MQGEAIFGTERSSLAKEGGQKKIFSSHADLRTYILKEPLINVEEFPAPPPHSLIVQLYGKSDKSFSWFSVILPIDDVEGQ